MTPEDQRLQQLLLGGTAPQTQNEPFVQISINGKMEQVPASVGTYMALSNLNNLVEQLNIRLEALHAHAAAGAHPKSKGAQTCMICRAQSLTPEQIEEIRISEEKAAEAAAEEANKLTFETHDGTKHEIDANVEVHPDINTEEETEPVQE